MSFVECIECGEKLEYVAPAHLKRHGLTSKEYRGKYPTAPMRSERLRKNHSEFRKRMRLDLNCWKCGKPFTTRSPKARYCRECQRVRDILKRREASLRCFRRQMNSGKVDMRGTFGKRYLEIVNGRVSGAVLLEDRRYIRIYGVHTLPACKGSPPVEYEANYMMISRLVIPLRIAYIIIYLIKKRKIVCSECGSQITVARENEAYTIPAEICCKSCGLVYEIDDLAELT